MSESMKQINESENAKLFRTRMDIFVLNALNEKEGQGYGYDVISYIQEHTKGHYKIKSISTIYNILKRLEASGYVSTVEGDNESYGAARVYYALTPAGKEYLEQDKKEWKYIRTLLDNLVSDEEFDLDNDEPPYSASLLKPLTKRSRDNGDASPSVDPKSDDSCPSSIIPAASSQNDAQTSFLPEEDVPFYNYSDDAKIVTESKESNHSFETPSSVRSFGETAASQYSSAAAKFRRTSSEAEQINAKNHQPSATESTSRTDDRQNETESPTPSQTATIATDYTLKPVIPESDKNNKTIEASNEECGSIDNNSASQPRVYYRKDDESLSPYIENLKKSLLSDGYTLHTFNTAQKPNTVRYFFSNKIMRDMSVASFLYLIVTLLITNLFKNVFNVSLITLHLLAGLGFAFVLFQFVSYLMNPKKKKKDAVNLKLLNSVLLLIFTVGFMAFAVYYLFTSKYSFYSPQMYAPAIILSTVPFSGLMYSILYISGKYYQK